MTTPSNSAKRIEEIRERFNRTADIHYWDAKFLLAHIERLEKALPDPDKLDLIADWLDLHDDEFNPSLNDRDVQRDFRSWANSIRAALTQAEDKSDE